MSSATRREPRSEGHDGLRELLLKDEFVHEMICARAYEIYQQRGREDGHDREDWLQAEREILDGLIGQARAGRLVFAEYTVAPDELSGGPAPVSQELTGLQATHVQAPYPDSYYNPHPDVLEDFAPLPAETISFQVRAPVAPAIPEASRYVEEPRKKREKGPKSETPRKHKKIEVAAEAGPALESEKTKKKKSGNKSKESKSKERKKK